jgi:hypothetical protein
MVLVLAFSFGAQSKAYTAVTTDARAILRRTSVRLPMREAATAYFYGAPPRRVFLHRQDEALG